MSIRDEALQQAREELAASAGREQHLVHAVRLFYTDSREQRLQQFSDWYGVHFPELADRLSPQELLEELEDGVERSGLGDWSGQAQSSTGSQLPEREAELLEQLRDSLSDGEFPRKRLERYIEKVADELIPNLSNLLGGLLAARLVAIEGSLESLARSPSSRIQTAGAEKALFRHLSDEGSPPKHGVLAEHRFVRELPETERGKMARFLANKASIAARLDFYGEKERGEELLEEARERFEELKN